MSTKITLLQYNVNKSRDKVLIGLLNDKKVDKFDFLAIQEPWRNPISIGKGYNPGNSQFYLIEKDSKDAKTAIYVNKRIPRSYISEIYKEKDLILLKYQSKNAKSVYIYNIYNPPISHSAREAPVLFKTLERLLKSHKGEHQIVLGDFNLHHSLWNSPNYRLSHYIAEDLIDIMSQIGATLYTPKGLATRDCQRGLFHEQTTIDLIFSTNLIEKCAPRYDLDQSSDHIPIATTLYIERPQNTPQTKQLWAKIDLEAFLKAIDNDTQLQGLLSTTLANRESIDLYIAALQSAINRAISLSVPIKRGSKYDKGFWNQDCEAAVRETRKLRRVYSSRPTAQNWENFKNQRNAKGKTLNKAKRAFYREKVKEIAQKSPWSLYKWAKKQEKGNIQSFIPTLKAPEGYLAISIEDKATLLRKTAFPKPLEANLEDIKDY